MRLQISRAALAALALVVGMIASSCGSGDSSGPVRSASWTYMIYMAVDNSLSPYAKSDINEMETVGSSEEVNVVVEAEFNTGTTVGVPAGTVRGLVAKDADQGNMGSWFSGIGDQDMTDPATLSGFIAWAARTYPADRYALVLWSHGMGWKDGSGGDASYKGLITDGSSPAMSIAELSQAIRDGGVHFEVINFDACLMGMYEVACELEGTAAYLVFSEEEYPANGDPYDAVLANLTLNPSMDGRQLVETIAADTLAFYDDADMTVTKSAVDMAVMDQLHAEVCDLSQYLVAHMNSAEKAMIEEARDEAYACDYPTNIDLGDFLQKLHDQAGASETLKALIEQIIGSLSDPGTLSQLVVVNDVRWGTTDASHTNITNSRGIAIYLPSSDPTRHQISTTDLTSYAGLVCNQTTTGLPWSDFLNSFLL